MVLRLCQRELTSQGISQLTELRKREILQANDKMAGQALRVLALAEKPLAGDEGLDEHIEEDLTFVGLAGMIDPPRASAGKAIQVCRRAGIKPVMITGDHRLTAEAVAHELGIIRGGSSGILTGVEIQGMNDEELAHSVLDVSVYARVTPKDKLRIVRAM